MAQRQSTASSVGDGDDNSQGDNNIRVVVRVRPQNTKEREGNHKSVIRVLDENVLVFDPKEEASPGFFHGKRRSGRDMTRRKNKDIRFAFDYVFDTDASNRRVYENTTQVILGGLLDGFNCSVFAYGATGAGKTFTMLGSKENPGVVFHTMMELYERIELVKAEKTCDVAVSYMEVYNEQIRDLLNPGGFLPLREDPKRGAIVAGLSLHKPRSAEELLHMLEFGNKNRTQHPTDANAESSRSHAVFQVFVRQQDRTANISADMRVAKMSLIDLAGSERATVTKNRGARFREGANINRSLLALGNCINALADTKYKGYVPYRNSKLTRLLKDSLGGNCRTVMIAAASPSSASLEDTHNTLKYADRAKNIKANLKRNVVSIDFHVTKYAKIVEELRAEVSELKSKLRKQESQPPVASKIIPASAVSSSQNIDPPIQRVRDDILSVFSERLSIQKEALELEGSERDLTYKIHRKQKAMARIAAISVDPTKALSRLERSIASSTKRRAAIATRKQAIHARIDRNQAQLTEAEKRMPKQPPQDLLAVLRCQHLDLELKNSRRQIKCMRKLVRAQHRDAQHANKMLCVLLPAFKRQYYMLKGHGIATKDIHEDFENIQNMAGGEGEVAWADESVGGGAQNDENERMEVDDGLDIDHLLSFPSYGAPNPAYSSPMPRPRPKTARTPASCLKQHHSSTPNVPRHPPSMDKENLPPPGSSQSTPYSSTHHPTITSSSSSHQPSSAPARSFKSTPKPPRTTSSIQYNTAGSANSSPLNSTVVIPACDSVLLTAGLMPSSSITSPDSTANSEQQQQQQQSPLQDATFVVAGSGVTSTPRFSSSPCVNIREVMLNDTTNQNHNRLPVCSGTVTKSKPSINYQTVNGVNSGTVTKSTNGYSEHILVNDSAKRSINFDIENQPSPAGKLTFAEAVKSPGKLLTNSQQTLPPRSVSRLHTNVVPVRSPLAPCENVLQHRSGGGTQVPQRLFHHHHHQANKHTPKHSPSKIPRHHTSSPKKHSPRTNSPKKHSPKYKPIKRLLSSSTSASDIRANLHRLGLPSLTDRSSNVQSQQQQPNYMRMTNAASNRQRAGLLRHPSLNDHDRGHSRGRQHTPPSDDGGYQKSTTNTLHNRSRSQCSVSSLRRTIKGAFA